MSQILKQETKTQNLAVNASNDSTLNAHSIVDTKSAKNDDINRYKKHNISKVLKHKGYIILEKISKTLQGGIYLCKHINNNNLVVIKTASVNLHKKGISIINNNVMVRIQENIIKEARIMKYLSCKNPPKGFIKCTEFFCDNVYFYMVMEHGGQPFWEYVMECIDKVKEGKLELNKWKIHIQKLFKQMCLYIKWLHNNNVCHLDLSLENCLIKDNIVYFCDFGLSECFKNNFICNKYCGKITYQSPEIYNKAKYFDASKADIWSLGCILFLLHTGSPLYKRPTNNDPYYWNVINGHTKRMVNSWGMKEFIDDTVYDLLSHIIVNENKRYNINEILNHVYLKNIKTY